MASSTAGGGGAGGASGKSGPAFEFSNLVKKYFEDVFKQGPDGMKALLVDSDTMKVLSAVYNHSDLLKFQVVLIETLGESSNGSAGRTLTGVKSNDLDENDEDVEMVKEAAEYLSCVVLVRPTSNSVQLLAKEIECAYFTEYHIVFTNMAETDHLTRLGMADKYGVIKAVHEIFLDLHPVGDQTAVIPLQAPQGAIMSLKSLGKPWNPLTEDELENNHVERIVQGMAGMFLMAKRRPQLRYRSGSKAAQKIAQELSSKLRSLRFSFPDIPERDSVCIILDRKDDPVTPLLTQWTYQAMIHELVGIEDGKVVIDNDEESDRPIEERVIVLSKHHDSFFGDHRASNFGEACSALQDVVTAYKELSKATDLKTATLDDLKSLIKKAPNVRQQSVIAMRHTEILTLLDDAVKSRSLLDLSLLEQDLAAKDNHKEHANQIREVISNVEKYTDKDVIRVCLLYCLRYQNQSDNITTEIKRSLETKRNFSDEKIALIEKILDYAGSHRRVGDCFRPNSSASKLKTFVKAMAGFQNDKSAQSIYTQHEPWMKKILNSLYNDVLPVTEYPFMHIGASEASSSSGAGGASSSSAADCILYPKTVFVFVVGGTTYEESLFVENVNLGKVDNKPPVGENTSSWSDRLAGMGRTGTNDEGADGDGHRGPDAPGQNTHHEHAPPRINTKLLLASNQMLTSEMFLEHIDRHLMKK